MKTIKSDTAFPITSVSINDIIQNIEDGETDELKKALLIRKASKLTENQMKWIAEKMCDNYVENYFWGDLEYCFKEVISDTK